MWPLVVVSHRKQYEFRVTFRKNSDVASGKAALLITVDIYNLYPLGKLVTNFAVLPESIKKSCLEI